MRRGRGGPRGVAARFPGCVCAWRWGVRRGEGARSFPVREMRCGGFAVSTRVWRKMGRGAVFFIENLEDLRKSHTFAPASVELAARVWLLGCYSSVGRAKD